MFVFERQPQRNCWLFLLRISGTLRDMYTPSSFSQTVVGWLVYSCCSHLEHPASVKRFVSLQFFNLGYSAGLLGREISPSKGRYLQHKHRIKTDIHASSGIRTQDPSVLASEDSSCLRPRGHRDRLPKRFIVDIWLI
jgi:hypothetical protein